MSRRFAAVLVLAAASAFAQKLDPVQWTLAAGDGKIAPGGQIVLTLKATLEPGWHMYSPSTPPGGPIATTITVADSPAVDQFSVHEPKPETQRDPNFDNLEVRWFEKEVSFALPVQIKKDAGPGEVQIAAQVRYQACDAKQCLPPRKKTATAAVTIDPAAPSQVGAIPAGYLAVAKRAETTRGVNPGAQPPANQPQAAQNADLGQFLLIAFGLGLAAIFTPCVFPMIPITVSFFLNQQTGSRRDSILQALVFCLGIVVLFCALGFAITAIVGPFGVVQLGSNPWVNGFIALVFFVFGLSLLGAFEITLPSGLLTKLDSASRGGGYVGTLLMGLTFSLTSFACVGPFVGTLLAASVQSKGMQPVLGMLFFAIGLATPFFFLALFPSYLQRLPRSGGWMARVKIVLGFIVLAAMFKYLSNVDQVLQTDILSRPVFLAAWVVLFALPGLYLLGFLRMEGVKPEDRVGVARLLTASAFLIFAVSLLPGLFGASLGAVEAYVPPATSGSLFGNARGESQVWLKNQYKEALAQAKQENKLVLVTFTGYACTNCHWMKANMFPRPEIASVVKQMVLVELYTDGTDEASERNQEMEDKLFQTVAIPFYALMDADGKVIASFGGSTGDAKKFLAFLQTRAPQQS
jgi:thiol:disulfide interchange protein DsbD